MTEWFEEWFGEEYLQLYPHRDEADARRLVALLTRVLPWRAGWRVLDVGCGAGRHAAALAEAGTRPIGLDLSLSLLRRARDVSTAPLVRADMRWLPIRAASMDLTVNLFTSFGYFEADDEHAAVLREMAATVRHGGWFVIDFLNATAVRSGLVPSEEQVLAGATVRVERRLADDGRFVLKSIRTTEGRLFQERVRLFSPEELETLVIGAGIEVTARFGDYAGGPLADAAPRTILIGRRP